MEPHGGFLIGRCAVDREDSHPEHGPYAIHIGPAINQFTNKPRNIVARKVVVIMYTIKDDEKVVVELKPKSRKGNPTELDTRTTPPVWETSDPEIADITPSDDGYTCTISGGKTGNCRVIAKGDADRSDGVREIGGVFDVTVVAGDAFSLDIVPVGPAVPQ